MAFAKDPDIVSAHEVAEIFGLSIHSVYEGAARGDIPCRRVGKRLLFSRVKLHTWAHGQQANPVVASDPWKPSQSLTGKDG